jgi:AraC family transcriptional regulator of adaptative response/methylated-DNA-[protein]-cysteine methyltransferase
MVAVVVQEGVALLEFADRPMLETQLKRVSSRLDCSVAPGNHSLLSQLREELDQYFTGKLHQFSVPLVLAGTPIQEAVWTELARIPYGDTTSYQSIAKSIGRPTARRAVGRANGDNRLAILLPCHRVVGQDGTLTGYGGGLWRKRRLLALEQQGQAELAVATG